MAYKCRECGHIFDEGEEAVWKERYGEYWGMPAYKEMKGCPMCHSEDYEETTRCEVCGSEHLEDELFGGVCEECLDKARHDFKLCHKICGDEKQEIKINALLASIFDVGDIEQILMEYIAKQCDEIDCSNFIDNDADWFGEQLAKEVNKNENGKN